ncbi:MAG: magnesium/cobalt transporter CorA [Chloroflexi bacterium]|nr:magnesium/cobalt transporter CorA [Chloroflexota bacterium]
MITHACTRSAGTDTQVGVLSGPEARREPLDVAANELVWVDIADPTPDDIDWLERTFHFHQLALEDVTRRHQRAKIDEYADYYFAVFYAARPDAAAHRIVTSELQFFWGATYLVTIHTAVFPEIADLVERVRDQTLTPVITAGERRLAIADLVYRLIDTIVDGYSPAVDALADWSEGIEEAMFSRRRRRAQDTLYAIFALKKQLLEMRRLIAPGRDVVNVLLRRDHTLFGDEFVPYFQDVYDHTARVIDSLDTYRDLLASALDAHLSIISNEVSQTVKKMTALTAILMVNSLIAGIYGMNFDFMPELHLEYGYAYALSLMLVASLLMWMLFRRIQWW